MRSSTHLHALETEAIHIFWGAVAECRKQVMLFAIGKDMSVLLRLTIKALFPSVPLFPIMHVDTTRNYLEMIKFRDKLTANLGADLIAHVNQDGVEEEDGYF